MVADRQECRPLPAALPGAPGVDRSLGRHVRGRRPDLRQVGAGGQRGSRRRRDQARGEGGERGVSEGEAVSEGMTFPPGFVWGTATAAHQIEGGNWNNDWWRFE